MEYLTHLLKSITSELFANSMPHSLLLQVAVIFIASIGSLYVRRRWNQMVDKRIADSSDSVSRVIALRGTKRLSFSLSFAILILLVYGLFDLFGYSTGLFYLAWPLALVQAVISMLVFLLRVAAGPGSGNQKTERILSIGLWTICALYLLGWLPVASELLGGIGVNIGDVRITLLGIIKFVIIVAILMLLALALSRSLEGGLSEKAALDSGVRLGVIKVIRYSLLSFAVLVALSLAGFDLTTLTVVGGALGIGIGFGLKTVTSNLISGFLVLFDRSIRPGDVISIGESYGWVEKMSARYLVVRDRNGVDTLIPNEELITTRVINWSYGDRCVRFKLPVQISYNDDPRLAMQLLLEAAGANDRVIEDPVPAVRLTAFGDNGINIELRVWISDPEQGVGSVRSDIYLAIWDAFKAHGITIPFPQRDLHLELVSDQAERSS